MFHRRERIWFGIRLRIAAVLLAVFLVGGGSLYWGIHTQIQRSQEEQIIRELQGIRENTEIYVRQLLMINKANNNEESYEQIAGEMARELYASGRRPVSVLDKTGRQLEGSTGMFTDAPKEDLMQALEGKAAFTLTYPDTDKMLVYFSMPVSIEGKTIGMIRYRVDNSWMFSQGRQMEQVVCQTAVLVFAVIFFVLFLLLGRMLGPIQRLTVVSRQVTRDLAREQVDTKMLAQLADSRRKDEVGELSRNFSTMLEVIGAQFQKMRDDKEQIIRLLGSRQEFYNNVTHELKTPLTTIQGYAQLMEADGGKDEQLTEQGLHHILQESTRMHQMVLQLLEMADKSKYMERRPVDLAKIAGSVAAAMEIKAERYAMWIETELPAGLWVQGVEDRLRQVLINLVDNAIKYGDAHSGIRICGAQKEGTAVLSVWNQGKGLKAEEQERIFEPFYRVDKAYSREQGSSGLGLSICRKIMEEHGGSIGVKSEPGIQTVFYIRLKAEPGEEAGEEI